MMNVSHFKNRYPALVSTIKSFNGIQLGLINIISLPCYGNPKTRVSTAKRDIAVISQDYNNSVKCTLNGRRILVYEPRFSKFLWENTPGYRWAYVDSNCKVIGKIKKGFPAALKITAI